MSRRFAIYTSEKAKMVWDSVAFNNSRQFAFFDGTHWYHPQNHFADFDEFFNYLNENNIKDVHVKALEDNGGREWVIDVDFIETGKILEFKIETAKKIFINFYKENIARIMHSGNRGLHVWLRIDRFLMSSKKSLRTSYYSIFVQPETVILDEIVPGSFIHAVKTAVEEETVAQKIEEYFKVKTLEQRILAVWPQVDSHVFCNLNQIRAPFSFNSKGRDFSKQLY
ncbi:lef-1 [Cryptophlebia peltastica nucleopolyhedrovirus]|uniref:Lef-1 n=1 Tax=Cryptophlebia peltastica nucleopolyhedrovirus TaxID=2304025 RepID=A0A346RNZ3_9ABAC|nr:lef-1 [Cryptophlebia peltastica nucleopolyhedrovirus]AXS67790.1 lef-1 [Cryptophlebia peltastica nucleopolyhedrovirus]